MDPSPASTSPSSFQLQWPSEAVQQALEEAGLMMLWLGRRIEATIAGDGSLEQWQDERFASQAHELFLERGTALDRVCLSVLQSDDAHLAQEWQFKLLEGDASFAQLAPQSLGSSRDSGGHLGPVRLEDLQAPMDRLVLRAQPGVIQPPLRLPSGRSIVLRLDSRYPAQWDDAMRRDLILRLHRQWLAAVIETLQTSPPAPGATCTIPLP
jgi:hypothetical protein